MLITEREAKSILTAQSSGFLVQGPYPFTHTLSPFTGCQFGATTCGLYCYAQLLPSWQYRSEPLKPHQWGHAVEVKANAPELVDDWLKKSTQRQRQQLRIFMSTATDPYQPLEKTRRVTRRILEKFAGFTDLDLLVVQTRSPLAGRDLDVLAKIPYAWLSITIETDDEEALLQGGPRLAERFKLAAAAVEAGVQAQITVSPCLPHSPDFARKLLATGVQRFVVDSFVAGDGASGARTARLPYSRHVEDWDDDEPAKQLFTTLAEAGVDVGWSADGFCGIPYRSAVAGQDRRGRSAEPAEDGMQLGMFEALPPPEGAMVLTLGQPGAPRTTLPGFPYFWLKYVTGIDARYHCAQGLVGPYHRGVWGTMKLPSVQVLNQPNHAWDVAYLCGVAETQWADNLHVPVVPAAGEEVEVFTYNGIRVHITNARKLDIPWLPDGWNGFPRSFTTCRNFQLAVSMYGYDGVTRPQQPEFKNPNNGRTPAALERARKRREAAKRKP